MLGGEDYRAHPMFIEVARKEIEKIPGSYNQASKVHIDAFLRSGTYTIRQIERKTPDIGGEIRYAIIIRNQDYVEAISPYTQECLIGE